MLRLPAGSARYLGGAIAVVGARHGVGHLLADTFHRVARELGFLDVIHALMHIDNVSLDRSRAHAARIFRRYALMGRRLR